MCVHASLTEQDKINLLRACIDIHASTPVVDVYTTAEMLPIAVSIALSMLERDTCFEVQCACVQVRQRLFQA
jgi:hypothetical protein